MTVLTDNEGYSTFNLVGNTKASTQSLDVRDVRHSHGCQRLSRRCCSSTDRLQHFGFHASDSDRDAAYRASRNAPAIFDTAAFKKKYNAEKYWEISRDGQPFFILKPEKVEVGINLDDAIKGDLRSVRAKFKNGEANFDSRVLLDRITDVIFENPTNEYC